jgi:hypothetical protein
MNDPKRLLEEGSELEAQLLGSAMDDAPSRGLERRVHVALGIGGVALGAGAASTTAAAATKATPYLVSFGVAKWVGIVALGAGSVAGARMIHARATAQADPPVAATVALQGGIPAARTPNVDIPPPPPPVPGGWGVSPQRVDEAPPAPAAERRSTVHSTVPPAAVAATPPPAAGRSGMDEIALVDRAHAALESGDTRLALETLDRRDLDFPSGLLGPESIELRVEAYAQRGAGAKGGELGTAFLAKYPTHPLAKKVQSLMMRASSSGGLR